MSGKGVIYSGTLDFGPIPNYLYLINDHDIHKNTHQSVWSFKWIHSFIVICDPLCEIHAKDSKSNEKASKLDFYH